MVEPSRGHSFACSLASLCLLVSALAHADEVVVAPEHTVTFEYKLTLPDATVVASSEGGEPIEYVHGRKQLLTALENALAGLKVGDKKRIEIPPDDAYGQYDDANRSKVERKQLPDDVTVGAQLISNDGKAVVVLELDEEHATLDTNHPMAGKTLIFDVEIAKIVKAEPLPSPSTEVEAAP